MFIMYFFYYFSLLFFFFFFFSSRRRHTRFDCDWSSDVCSSDLRSSAAVSSLLQVLFPRANGPEVLDKNQKPTGTAGYSFTRLQPTDEYFAQGRIDHRLSGKDILFGRYTFDNGNVQRQVRDKPPDVFTKERSRNQYLTLEHVHSFSQALINTLRVSFARSTAEVDNQRLVDVPSNLWWIPPSAGGVQFGFLTIQGLVTEM